MKRNIDFVEKREGRTRRVKKTGWKRKDGKPGRKKKNVKHLLNLDILVIICRN